MTDGEAAGTAARAVAEIEVLAKEGHSFPPPEAFKAQAIVQDDSLYRAAEEDLEGFWLEHAKQFVDWMKEPTKSLEWDPPEAGFARMIGRRHKGRVNQPNNHSKLTDSNNCTVFFLIKNFVALVATPSSLCLLPVVLLV